MFWLFIGALILLEIIAWMMWASRKRAGKRRANEDARSDKE